MIKIRDKSCSSHKSRAWGTSEAEAEQCQGRIHPLDPHNGAVYTSIDTSHKTHYCYTDTALHCYPCSVLAAMTRGGGRQRRGPGGGGEKTDHYLIIPGYYDRAKLLHRHSLTATHIVFFFSCFYVTMRKSLSMNSYLCSVGNFEWQFADYVWGAIVVVTQLLFKFSEKGT